MANSLFHIILTLIPILGAITTYFIIPYVKTIIGAEKLSQYEEWAVLAVKCAECIFAEQGMGKDKKAYAVGFLNGIFNRKKTVITEEQLNVLIESAVHEINKNRK